MSDAPFDPVPDSGKFDAKTLEGCAVVVVVGGTHRAWPIRGNDPKDAVRLALVALNGDRAGEEFIDVMMFNAPVLRAFGSLENGGAGKITVGRVKVDRQYANPAVSFEKPTDAELALATRWNEANPGRAAQLADIMKVRYAHNEANRGNRSNTPLPGSVTQQPAQQYSNYANPAPSAPPPPAAPPPAGPPPVVRPDTDEPPF